MEDLKSQTTQTHFRLKLGTAEIEFSGDAEFLKSEIMPAVSRIVSVAETHSNFPTAKPIVPKQIEAPQKSGSRRPKVNSHTSSVEETIDFKHDPNSLGSPKQSWTTTKKSVWLIHVVSKQTDHSDLSTIEIVKTFNIHFRQAKTVTSSNVSRDLGKAKISSPSLVGEDATKNPPRWFLTDEGKKYAQRLIDEDQNSAEV